MSSDPSASARRGPLEHEQSAQAPFPRLLAVVGPTGSGKTALALALAESLGGEIINTDSLQVYRYMDIGTAKPSAEERERVPHHLIDVVDPDESFSAGRYEVLARAAVRDIEARGKVPILCGGTGLYYRALVHGLVDVPAVPAAVQAQVEARMAQSGTVAAHAELAVVDPATAAAVHPHDPQRIARALAVHAATGRPLSAFRAEQPYRAEPWPVLTVGVRWQRAALYERINARVEAMFAAGWVEEVRGLLARGYGPEHKPLRAIGYLEIATALREGRDPMSMAPAIAQRTRRYAKRQLTWFRRHPEVHWAEPSQWAPVLEAARNFLLPQPAPR